MKHLIGYLSLLLLLGLALLPAASPEISQAASGVQQGIPCDAAEFARLKVDFQQMIKIRTEQPGVISDEAFKAAALAYTSIAENCFHTLNKAKPKGAGEPVMIDEGGLSPYPGLGPLFNTTGLKWGKNSPYPGGQNVSGPGTPGGTVTYSYIPAGIKHAGSSVEPPGSANTTNVNVLTSLGVNSCIQSEIATVFAAWAAISNIQFVQVADSGVPSNTPGATGNIRIGAHPMDGLDGTLAHGYFPPSTGDTFTSIAGDLHFDTAEPWTCNPGDFVYDIGLTALHELGHAIGLNHEPAIFAVMNPFYNPDVVGLQQDDINGAATIYGPRAAIPASCLPLFNDTHEDGFANWSVSSGGGTPNNWQGKTDGKGYKGSANYWLVADIDSVSDAHLTSQSFNVTDPDLTLHFFHAFELETGYDGGVVEISVNGGAFKDVGSANFTKNGYNLTISSISGNPLGGRPAFSGVTNVYRESSIKLDSLLNPGNNFRIRFREANDEANPKTFAGWRLDDVKLCRLSRSYLPLLIRQR